MYKLNYNIDLKIQEQRKRYFKKYVTDNFKDIFTFIIDTREQDKFIKKCFDLNNVSNIDFKLDIGDYGIFFNDLPDIDNTTLKLAIERKKSLLELVNNIFDKKHLDSSGNNRFERELIRAHENDVYLRLLCEEDIYSNLINERYKTITSFKLSSVENRLHSLMSKYKFTIEYIPKYYMPKMIKNIYLSHIRNIFIYDSGVNGEIIRDYIRLRYNIKKMI